MGFFDIFRRQPPIREIAALADFIDANAAFVMQQDIYDYTHARAGPYAKVLSPRPSFKEARRSGALERLSARARHGGARWWRACCIGRDAASGCAARDAVARSSSACSTAIDVPVIGAGAWRRSRDELALRLEQVGLHPPKSVIDIPETYVERTST